jgi:hypothetical protein
MTSPEAILVERASRTIEQILDLCFIGPPFVMRSLILDVPVSQMSPCLTAGLFFLWFSVIPTLTGWAIQRAPLRGGFDGVIESVPQHFAGVIVPTCWPTG